MNKDYLEFVSTDGMISLYRNKIISENANLNESQAECFEIIKNETKENIGVISYRYNDIPDYIDYGGNINYRIKEEYRGNGYAKKAFNLMINILKKNIKYDQPLYVSSVPYNEDYLKVASECGGKLIHSGPVPKNVIDSFYDKEMKNVCVYRFDIEKEKERKL